MKVGQRLLPRSDHERCVADWGHIFEDTTVAPAVLDRLLHHASVLSVTGDSYRLARHLATAAESCPLIKSKRPYVQGGSTGSPVAPRAGASRVLTMSSTHTSRERLAEWPVVRGLLTPALRSSAGSKNPWTPSPLGARSEPGPDEPPAGGNHAITLTRCGA